jgi:5-formyltetrahydrofolate cyclo-ligase
MWLSSMIAQRLAALDACRTAGTVLGYMNFGAEFAASGWMQQALADGKRVLLPKVNRATNELDVYHVTDLQRDVTPGLWDILEPLPERCAAAKLNEINLILLPGVAFGRDGARLGYGGGYYDKLLARLNHHPALVAAAYSLQIVEGVPQEATDRKVEWLVTENETIECAATRGCHV